MITKLKYWPRTIERLLAIMPGGGGNTFIVVYHAKQYDF